MSDAKLAQSGQSDLTELDRREVAGLIYLAVQDFYDALPVQKETILGIVAKETLSSGAECENPWLFRQGSRIIGVICAFPLAELQSRQQQSMLGIMRSLDGSARKKFRDTIRNSDHSVQPIEAGDGGLYLARVAVLPELQGAGLGRRMFECFQAELGTVPLSLHVDRQNPTAIGFYKNLGFDFPDDESRWKKQVMQRSGK